MNEIFYPSHDGKTKIHACIWRPEGEIKGVVQIIHGMAEYAARYAPFAEFLNDNGYLVVAEDHLGHGQSVLSEKELGYFNKERSTQIVIDDIRSLQAAVKKQFPDKPYFILGHSMGSFFCRKYISLYGSDFNGAIIMGTGFKNKFTIETALAAVRINALFCGWHHRSKLIRKLAFGRYGKRVPAFGDNVWLSKDTSNIEAYEADPLCGFYFTNNGYNILFNIIKQACSKNTIESVPKNLPVYFVAGEEDPVGDYGKGVKKAKAKFDEAGIEDVSITLYEKARHEILNDFCKGQVEKDILSFIENHSGDKNA